MEEQYGEHYAQKVEDRLLHYLHELETVLPGDTYIDKVCVLFECALYSACNLLYPVKKMPQTMTKPANY